MSFLKKLFGPSERNIAGFGLTDRGRVRDNNEDYFAIAEDRNLFVVADGMGGHNAGEVASKMAADAFVEFLSMEKIRGIRKNPAAIQHTIITGFYKVNQDVMDEAAKSEDRKGMGCTLVTCFVDGEWAYVAHVGDVRCYYYKNGDLCQVTTDHSSVRDMEYTEGGKQVLKKRNIVTMGIGFPFPEDPVLHQIPTKSKGRLLLCSDGLWGMLDDQEIAGVLASDISLQEACEKFVEKANNAGGKDNVTALVIQL